MNKIASFCSLSMRTTDDEKFKEHSQQCTSFNKKMASSSHSTKKKKLPGKIKK